MSAGYAREVVQKMHGRSMSELPGHTKPRRVKVRRHQREA